MIKNNFTKVFAVKNYDLNNTLDCGQTFRWENINNGWEGIIYGRWVRLEAHPEGIKATVAEEPRDWRWLEDYLQLNVDIDDILGSLPSDEYIQNAIKTCSGLRIVRQEPWECLASFICSSSKQIVQIKQIISLLCERLGRPIRSPYKDRDMFAFPELDAVARAEKKILSECKMGFRADYLYNTARRLHSNEWFFEEIKKSPYNVARKRLTELSGVGNKIADCVLLFGFGFNEAFPIDVWIRRALERFYFKGKKVPIKELETFAREYFGRNAGYAQQYLYHYARKYFNDF